MTATITEVASNTATANILLPILSEMVTIFGISSLFPYQSNFLSTLKGGLDQDQSVVFDVTCYRYMFLRLYATSCHATQCHRICSSQDETLGHGMDQSKVENLHKLDYRTLCHAGESWFSDEHHLRDCNMFIGGQLRQCYVRFLRVP